MKKTFCDRCDMDISALTVKNPPEAPKLSLIVEKGLEHKRVEVDLCPDCNNKLMEWLNQNRVVKPQVN